MKLSSNFKAALVFIIAVVLVLGGIFLYSVQLVNFNTVKGEMVYYREVLGLQARMLTNKITSLENELKDGLKKAQTPAATSTVIVPAEKK